MNPSTARTVADDEDLHMGSEYASARRYLAQKPRDASHVVRRRPVAREPQHGSNDSDFGIPDQNPE